MGDVHHPGISESIQHFLAPEEEFAKLAYETLGRYGVICDDSEQGIRYPVTDRVEISDDNEPTLRALRLRRTAVMGVASGAYPDVQSGQSLKTYHLSEEYVVLELQHGEVAYEELDPNEPAVDEDFTWSPYVMAVFKTSEDYDLDILDATTGKPLVFEDLFIATEALRHLNRWLYFELHENGLENDESIALGPASPYVQNADLHKTENFAPSEADLNYSCTECGEDNGVCDHNIPKMN